MLKHLQDGLTHMQFCVHIPVK